MSNRVRTLALAAPFLLALLLPVPAEAGCGGSGEGCCCSGFFCTGGCSCDPWHNNLLVCTPCGGNSQPICVSGDDCRPFHNEILGFCRACGGSFEEACLSGPACQDRRRLIGLACLPCGGDRAPACDRGPQCSDPWSNVVGGNVLGLPLEGCLACGGELQPVCFSSSAPAACRPRHVALSPPPGVVPPVGDLVCVRCGGDQRPICPVREGAPCDAGTGPLGFGVAFPEAAGPLQVCSELAVAPERADDFARGTGLDWPDTPAPAGPRTVFAIHGMTSHPEALGITSAIVHLVTQNVVYGIDYNGDGRSERPLQAYALRSDLGSCLGGVDPRDFRDPDLAVVGAAVLRAVLTGDAEACWDTARPVFQNGRILTGADHRSLQEVGEGVAAALRALSTELDVTLLAHSMGGLVAREVVYRHYDGLRLAGHRIAEVVTLGTPHVGGLLTIFASQALTASVSCGRGNLEALGALLGDAPGFESSPERENQVCIMSRWLQGLDNHRAQTGRLDAISEADRPQIDWHLVAGTGHGVAGAAALDELDLDQDGRSDGIGARFDGDGVVWSESALAIPSDGRLTLDADHGEVTRHPLMLEWLLPRLPVRPPGGWPSGLREDLRRDEAAILSSLVVEAEVQVRGASGLCLEADGERLRAMPCEREGAPSDRFTVTRSGELRSGGTRCLAMRNGEIAPRLEDCSDTLVQRVDAGALRFPAVVESCSDHFLFAGSQVSVIEACVREDDAGACVYLDGALRGCVPPEASCVPVILPQSTECFPVARARPAPLCLVDDGVRAARVRTAACDAANGAWAFGLFSDRDGDGRDDDVDNCPDTPNRGQRDSDADGYGNRCDGDLDQSGRVDGADLTLLELRFGSADPDADLDGDGRVTGHDRAILRSMWLAPPGRAPHGWRRFCGLGAEIALALPLVAALSRRRQRNAAS